MERELEVKILGIDLEAFENRIVEKGAQLQHFEKQTNLLFSPKALYGTDSYLRIRTTRNLDTGEERSVLTLKLHEETGAVRANREFTTPIEDPDMLSEILRLSGLGDPLQAEKIRKSYLFRGAVIDLDRWSEEVYPEPYAEIEVNGVEKLNEIIALLEIDESRISTKSIRQLIDERQAE